MKDTHDLRFPIIEWACGLLAGRLDGIENIQSRPDLAQLSAAESEAVIQMEKALHALPPVFIHDPDNFSVKEPSSAEQSAMATSLYQVSRFASQARVGCGEANWVDFGRIVDLLTELPAIVDAQRLAASTDRGLFWNWYEQTGEMLQERGRALLHEDSGAAELSSALQRLLDLSRLLQLRTVTSRLERVLLHLCKKTMVLAARQGKWEEFVTYRGQYLSCWHNVEVSGGSRSHDRHRSSPPTHLWGAIGASLATIHSQAAIPAFRGTKRARTISKHGEQNEFFAFTTFPSIAALRLDMSIAFRGTSTEEWNDFLEGYLKHANWPADFKAEIRKLNRPDAEGWTDEYHGVDGPPPQPELEVRLTHALQSGEVTRIDFTGRLECMRKAENLERRCQLAAQLITESNGIDAKVTNEATKCFCEGIQSLLKAGEFRAVVELGETALSQVREMIAQVHRSAIEGFVNFSCAKLERDAENQARLRLEAGRSFIKSRRAELLGYAVLAFYDAMRTTSQRETYSRSAAGMVMTMFWQGMHRRPQADALKAFWKSCTSTSISNLLIRMRRPSLRPVGMQPKRGSLKAMPVASGSSNPRFKLLKRGTAQPRRHLASLS